MTDSLTARLEAHLQNDDAALRHWDADNLIEEAQARIVELEATYDRMRDQLLRDKFSLAQNLDTADAEIERLRTDNDLWNGRLSYAHGEIERLRSCLKWEQNWLSRVGTHSEGCWQWGPGHYQCAVRHIKDLEQNSQMQEWKL